MMTEERRSTASFRDPSGFVFERGGHLYRQVDASYGADYDHLMTSGLYTELEMAGLLIPHTEVEVEPFGTESAHKVIEPARVPFVSYPYEWSFSALKDAALLTLGIQRRSLRFGMSLKDASAFNIQFRGGKPVLIDTLSFERYQDDQPWVAYRQFCRHFLAPLALMGLRDIRLGGMWREHLDGIPLDLASALLPLRSKLWPSLLVHLHLHARLEREHGAEARRPTQKTFSRSAMLGLVGSLESAIGRLEWSPPPSAWTGYEQMSHYSAEARAHKQALVTEYLDQIDPESVWDVGCNTGAFSRMVSSRGVRTLALDADPACVEALYRDARERSDPHILPLVMDLTNPTPALGWRGRERQSLLERGPADAVLALAIIHHLAFAANLPLRHIAELFDQVGRWLIVEFVPKTDPLAARLLAGRDEVFSDYEQANFERVFQEFFLIVRSQTIADSERTVYLMRRREPL
jgi:ribosomal protein L11 methylase PrmA